MTTKLLLQIGVVERAEVRLLKKDVLGIADQAVVEGRRVGVTVKEPVANDREDFTEDAGVGTRRQRMPGMKHRNPRVTTHSGETIHPLQHRHSIRSSALDKAVLDVDVDQCHPTRHHRKLDHAPTSGRDWLTARAGRRCHPRQPDISHQAASATAIFLTR